VTDNNQKIVLAVDTALQSCAVGMAWADGRKIGRSVEMERGHSERLVPLIQEVLKESDLEFKDLGVIVTTVGPGAFTGLRIGLSTARALGLALNVPVKGIATFDALARQYGSNDAVVVLETKRADFYGRIGDKEGCFSAEEIKSELAGKSIAIIGNALERLKAEVGDGGGAWKFVSGFETIDPAFIAALAFSDFEFLPPEPVYLRGADVTMSNKAQRTIA